jgi:leucyl aminopeptidase
VIGLYGEQHIDFAGLTMQAAKALASMSISGEVTNEQFFEQQLAHEQQLCDMINKLCAVKDVSEGTKQLLGDIANFSESRQYKIKQRLSL